MAYCGCGTQGNRVRWAVAILATIIGLVLIAAAIGTAASNINKYDDCLKECESSGQITPAQYDDNKDGPKWQDNNYGDTGIPCVDTCQNKWFQDKSSTVGGLFWAGVAALIIASIPCYVMCCCTSHPGYTHGQAQVAVPYNGGAPVATPYQPAYQTPQPTAYAYPPSASQTDYAAPQAGYPANQPAYYPKV